MATTYQLLMQTKHINIQNSYKDKLLFTALTTKSKFTPLKVISEDIDL